MPKRVNETSAGKESSAAEASEVNKKLKVENEIANFRADRDKYTGLLEDKTLSPQVIARYEKERALAEWELAKLEYPNDLVQLEAMRKALVDGEVRHEIENKKQSAMQLLPNATGALKEMLQQQLLDAIEAESSGSAKEIELRNKFEEKYPLSNVSSSKF